MSDASHKDVEHLNKLQEKFQGRRLINALRTQALVDGDEDETKLATRLAEIGTVTGFTENSHIYKDGDVVKGLWFVLHGLVEIRREGNTLGSIPFREHFGEFPFLFFDPTYTVDAIAVEDSVLFFLSEKGVKSIADDYPLFWHRAARTLASRLKKANMHWQKPNPIPQVFLGSSVEGLPVVRALDKEFQYDKEFYVKRWTEGFAITEYAAESLGALSEYDFAIIVFSADDNVVSRGEEFRCPRDNILFEAGMGFGQLGRKRTFIIQAQDDLIKTPSDLAGINIERYRVINGEPDVRTVANSIRKVIRERGSRTRLTLSA